MCHRFVFWWAGRRIVCFGNVLRVSHLRVTRVLCLPCVSVRLRLLFLGVRVCLLRVCPGVDACLVCLSWCVRVYAVLLVVPRPAPLLLPLQQCQGL